MKKGNLKIIFNGVIVTTILFLSSCIKENGKKLYSFQLYFETGDIWETDVLVDEKFKDLSTLQKRNRLNVTTVSLPKNILVNFFKVENNKLTGFGDISYSKFTITDESIGYLSGLIELDGVYKRKGKQYFVDNGVFSFYGSGLNQPITLYEGKWTLKRE